MRTFLVSKKSVLIRDMSLGDREDYHKTSKLARAAINFRRALDPAAIGGRHLLEVYN